MKNRSHIIPILFLFLILIGCTKTKEKTELNDNDGWKKDAQVLKTIQNVHFTFPSKGMAFDKREQYVKKCFDAIKKNSEMK